MQKSKKFISFVLAFSLVLTLFMFASVSVSAGGDAYATISAGYEITMAIKSDGSLWAWGRNEYGRLGNGKEYGWEYTPIKIIDDVVQVSAGYRHTMAIKSDGSLWAWGDNSSGQFGNGMTESRHSPIKIMDGVVQVSAGNRYTMAIKSDGSLWAWGNNYNGQLGTGKESSWEKTPIKIMDDVIQVSASEHSTMAIKSDSSLWAWGSNRDYIPIKIMDGVVQVSAGYTYTMAIKNDGSLWAWGGNSLGQLGDGTTDNRQTPIKIMDDVVQVSASAIYGYEYVYGGGSTAPRCYYTMAIKNDGSLWAWGRNRNGQLGIGTTEDRHLPEKVMDGVVQVSAGTFHTLAIKSDGSLWIWGEVEKRAAMYSGYISTNELTPVKIMDGMMLPDNNANNTSPLPEYVQKALESARALNLLPASLDKNYKQNITREEFCDLAVPMYEKIKGKFGLSSLAFSDTTNPNVMHMAGIGVVLGYPNPNGTTSFRPKNEISRQEAAVILCRLIEALIGQELPISDPTFTDVKHDEQNKWSYYYIGKIQAAKIMGGVGDNKFDPFGKYTREQSIVTLMRVWDYVGLALGQNFEIDTKLLASFSKAAYDEVLYKDDIPHGGVDVSIAGYSGWKLAHKHKQGVAPVYSGFWYLIFEKGNDIVVAFRGTPPPEIEWNLIPPGPGIANVGDWVNTLVMVALGKHMQDFNVESEIRGRIGDFLKAGRNVYITGHSLGGYLAVMASESIRENDEYGHLVKRVETFNAVGVSTFKNVDESKIVRNYTCCDIATWVSEFNPALKCVGEPRMLNLGSVDENHRHADEYDSKQWWEWVNIPEMIGELAAEKAYDLYIGVMAHAMDKFKPIEVKIASSGGASR